jgi:hypothetical protein
MSRAVDSIGVPVFMRAAAAKISSHRLSDLVIQAVPFPEPTISQEQRIQLLPRGRCWIDEKRYATMRIEFFGSGEKPAKTVTTQKVMRESSGFYAPVIFTVTDHTSGASTRVEGVRSESDVNYSDADFTEAALQSVTPAPGKSG